MNYTNDIAIATGFDQLVGIVQRANINYLQFTRANYQIHVQDDLLVHILRTIMINQVVPQPAQSLGFMDPSVAHVVDYAGVIYVVQQHNQDLFFMGINEWVGGLFANVPRLAALTPRNNP